MLNTGRVIDARTSEMTRAGGAIARLVTLDPSGQLAYLALFYALAFFLSVSSGFVFGHLPMTLDTFTRFELITAVVSILIALAVFVVARWKLCSEKSLIRIALGWEVLGVLGILIAESWHLSAQQTLATGLAGVWGISWACVVLAVFPVLVRTSVLQTAAASFGAAATGPAFQLIYGQVSGTPVPNMLVVGLSTPLFICAALSILPALVMRQVDQKIAKARQLGKYSLVARLGKGGMGEVWLAAHQMLIRPAAIKLIHSSVVNAAQSGGSHGRNLLKRFEREVQATASLESPHTVSVFDFGISDKGLFYYVMEVLNGLNAQMFVERFGALPAPRVIYLIKQVCHSLAEAHRHGLIHRDIKPANIYICRLGLEYDFVKVLDFGLVKAITDKGEDRTRLTMEGALAGTPAYMAPEVALEEKELDARLDIYSLGCVAYALVVGKDVFEGSSPMSVVLKHVKDAPVPPSERVDAPIPPSFERVIMACLEKDPKDRPQSANELAQMLEDCSVESPWDEGLARAWWHENLPEIGMDDQGELL